MNDLSWAARRRIVYERAKGCCEYCQTCEANTGQTMHVDHIDPAGDDQLDNLCLSCANCNLTKSTDTTAIDPATNERIALFNSRQQIWDEHFQWIESGLILIGLSPTGRATVQRLKLNQERLLVARRRWIAGGFHPPD